MRGGLYIHISLSLIPVFVHPVSYIHMVYINIHIGCATCFACACGSPTLIQRARSISSAEHLRSARITARACRSEAHSSRRRCSRTATLHCRSTGPRSGLSQSSVRLKTFRGSPRATMVPSTPATIQSSQVPWRMIGGFQHLGACRRRTPRARVGLKVPKNASRRDLPDANLPLVLAPRRSPSPVLGMLGTPPKRC